MIFCMADGSSWGKAAKEAVQRAVVAFKRRLDYDIKVLASLDEGLFCFSNFIVLFEKHRRLRISLKSDQS